MEKDSDAHASTAPPVKNKDSQRTEFEETMYQRNLFMGMALTMTWQLAIVVIVLIVGGYELDKHFGTAPWLTLAGVAVAAGGVAAVLRRVVIEAGRRANYEGKK